VQYPRCSGLGSPQAQIAIGLFLVIVPEIGLVDLIILFEETISLNYDSKSEPLAGMLLARAGATFVFRASSIFLVVSSTSFLIRNCFVRSFLFFRLCSFVKFLSIMIFSYGVLQFLSAASFT
jgi:hypothetical protein